jgi:hypothetical protein
VCHRLHTFEWNIILLTVARLDVTLMKVVAPFLTIFVELNCLIKILKINLFKMSLLDLVPMLQTVLRVGQFWF